jgi:hypothetical protein
MARKSGCGPLAGLVAVGVVFAVIHSQGHTEVAVLAAVVLAVVLLLGARPRKCQVCGGALQKKALKWKDGARTIVVCPSCSRRLQSKVSRAAVDKMFPKR